MVERDRSSIVGSMQEYSSVTASAYDADSLTTQLGEKSAEGWDVVSIVSAGSNVIAYLSREGSGEAAPAVEAVEAVEEPAPEQAEPAVEEPAGWAAAPDEPVDDTGADPTPSGAAAAATGVAAAGVATADDTAAAAPESAVPAGWYSDPSDRYELRYWDGSAWTEHVSRAGQQYTDPPVA
jgi:hypothetical protein